MKDIIHIKIPTSDIKGSILNCHQQEVLYKRVKDIVGSDYRIIISPYEITCITSKDKIVSLEANDEMIQKLLDYGFIISE